MITSDHLLTTCALLGDDPGPPARPRAPRVPQARLATLRCERTLPFELVADALDAFLALWGARHRCELSPYDPALPELEAWRGRADVRLLWLDWRLYRDRMEPAACAAWLAARAAAALAAQPATPVLVNNAAGGPRADAAWEAALNARLAPLCAATAGLYLADVAACVAPLGAAAFDARNDALASTPWSARAHVHIARYLATGPLASLLCGRLRALVLDLDDTLYAGTLAEDGVAGVRLTPGHQRLQRHLHALAGDGMVLALCSRNEPADVAGLLAARADFPLRSCDLVAREVSWRSKAEGVARLAEQLGFAPADMLLVDDNAAELLRAAEQAGPHVLLAQADADATLACLRRFPRMAATAPDDAGALRAADLRANAARAARRADAAGPHAYLASLQMRLQLATNCAAHAARLHALSCKTNQFNVSLARLSAAAAPARMQPPYLTVTAALQDVLSDSGIVAAVVFRIAAAHAACEDLVVSCRALGRDVESLLLYHGLAHLAAGGVRTVTFAPRPAPRNAPALAWLRDLAGAAPDVLLAPLLARLAERCRAHPAQVVGTAA